MIHHIKSLYANGQGESIRSIAEQLKISRNTVRKYLRMDEAEISRQRDNPTRCKLLDDYRDQIVHQLQQYPRLSAVKVLRKLREQGIETTFSDRTLRRYIETLRETVTIKQARYYMPVLDMVPGVQCQVDPGELRGVRIAGKEQTVYFVVFVLSFSRLMHVSFSNKPITTTDFIQMHDSAFRYFGGCPQECVYDQTKLVVIREEYRELTVNEQFSEYASHAGFSIRACEGYDPESKGKVEAGVKYVKGNGLYGECFADWAHLRSHMGEWLDTIANTRSHATTGIAPQRLYDEQERDQMKPYLTPAIVDSVPALTRKADKTGLISWKSNKYSVPMAYQRCTVGVREVEGTLCMDDLESGQEITRHTLSMEKGTVIKNTDHYRDRAQQVSDYEQAIEARIGVEYANRLCALLKVTSPKIYRDQLAGARDILSQYEALPDGILDRVLSRSQLSATGLRDFLDVYTANSERVALECVPQVPSNRAHPALAHYAGLSKLEQRHEFH